MAQRIFAFQSFSWAPELCCVPGQTHATAAHSLRIGCRHPFVGFRSTHLCRFSHL